MVQCLGMVLGVVTHGDTSATHASLEQAPTPPLARAAGRGPVFRQHVHSTHAP